MKLPRTGAAKNQQTDITEMKSNEKTAALREDISGIIALLDPLEAVRVQIEASEAEADDDDETDEEDETEAESILTPEAIYERQQAAGRNKAIAEIKVAQLRQQYRDGLANLQPRLRALTERIVQALNEKRSLALKELEPVLSAMMWRKDNMEQSAAAGFANVCSGVGDRGHAVRRLGFSAGQFLSEGTGIGPLKSDLTFALDLV